jgi:four helix bundle protein
MRTRTASTKIRSASRSPRSIDEEALGTRHSWRFVVSESVKSYRDLIAWQKAFALGLDVYVLTKRLPEHEKFGLISQLPIASRCRRDRQQYSGGYGRQSTADYIRFLRVARGCLYEIDTQLLFAAKLGYVEEKECEPLQDQLNECGRILAGLIRSLESRL